MRPAEELAFFATLLWQRGLVAGTSGNISVRLDDGTMLVTPSGRSLRELAPDELVRLTAAGEPRDPQARPTSELRLHVAAYRARPDARCLIHTHATFCVAWSKTGGPFPLDTVGATESLGSIAFTKFEPPGSDALAERCSAAFVAGANTVVMERHGISSIGETLEEAFARTDLAEQTAKIEAFARLLR